MVSSTKSIITLYAGAVIIFAGAILYTSLSTQRLVANSASLGSRVATLTVPKQSTTTSPSYTTQPTTSPTGSLTSSEPTSNVTTNWAGYEATSGTYSSVSGSWTVPQTTATSSYTSADATWVGIGGVTSNDLIQVGTQNLVAPSGQVETIAFYEMLPGSSNTIPTVTVSEGDKVTASVTEVGEGEWTISFKDLTTGQSYSSTVAYDSSESSAEWIEEEPSDGDTEIPLDNFGTVSFTNGSATDNGSVVTIKGSGAQALTLASPEGQASATTSSLGSDGASFTVTRTSASSATGIPEFNSDPGSWSRTGTGIGTEGNNWQWRTYDVPTGSSAASETSYSIPTPGGSITVVSWR